MDTQLKRYARKLVEEQLGQSRLQLAQIADDIGFIKLDQRDVIRHEVVRKGFAAKGSGSLNFLSCCVVTKPISSAI